MKHKMKMFLYWLALAAVIYILSFFIRIPEGYWQNIEEEKLFDRKEQERTYGQ